MSVTDLLTDARITRVLMVDDDLRTQPSFADLDESAQPGQSNVQSILNDSDHDATERLVDILKQNGRPHQTPNDLLNGLADNTIRQQCLEDITKPYDDAIKRLQGFQEPLNKIRRWISAPGEIELTTWSSIRDLERGEFYDLLIVDYYLVNNEATATRAFISKMLEAHKGREQPLLVILMSSNKNGVTSDLSLIRDEVGASSSRFRILVKPIATHGEPEQVVKERWLQALGQLASERELIKPIEDFVSAWKIGLAKATDTIVKRLYELDASAFAILSATARSDSMSIEEYMADVLAKRVSAETEEHAEVSAHTVALQKALDKASTAVGPTINQGVEIEDAQHAIRRLMSDVIWHRPTWYQPQTAAPERTSRPDIAPVNPAEESPIETPRQSVQQAVEPPAPIGDPQVASEQGAGKEESVSDVGAVSASLAPTPGEGTITGATENRLTWMKRNLRFGTVLREKHGRLRFFVNITQACDVQNVKLQSASDYHYLFIRGEKLPVDRVAVGEKIFESPYFAQSATDDEFCSLHWNLRQPFTPSMTDFLDTLEDYSIEGQLRNESAYAVLAKFVSQASRVAQLRMPKIYRCPVSIFQKEQAGWRSRNMADGEIYASSWERKSGIWCSQFLLDDAFRIVSIIPNATTDDQASAVAGLGKSTQLDVAKKTAAKKLSGGRIYLVKLKSDADIETASIIDELSKNEVLRTANLNDVAVVIKSAEDHT